MSRTGQGSSRRAAADRRLGWGLLAPALVVLGGLTVYPALWVFWLSLQYRIPVFSIARWAGLEQYAFLAVDPRFRSAARVTLLFTVASVALEAALGLAIALALRGQRRARRVALALLLLA
ncbi:MAG TPA: sugar ABC transporter permease, partial [Candidatus Bathyarchaeia archaeon]|nr:sugar ABC transporter permease [Candidatus Bathyarchaeia archaeon]